MSVLSPAQNGASPSHKLEFTVKSTEELNTVMEDLKACDSGATLQHSVSRSCLHRQIHAIKNVCKYTHPILTKGMHISKKSLRFSTTRWRHDFYNKAKLYSMHYASLPISANVDDCFDKMLTRKRPK